MYNRPNSNNNNNLTYDAHSIRNLEWEPRVVRCFMSVRGQLTTDVRFKSTLNGRYCSSRKFDSG